MDLENQNDVSMEDHDPTSRTVDSFTPSTAWSSMPAVKSETKQPLLQAPANVSKLSGEGLKREEDDGLLITRKDGPRPAKFKNLPYSSAQTGLVYDVRMRFHVELNPQEDTLHPEDPRRIHAIFEALVQAGLAWRQGCEGPSDYYMGRIDTRLVTKDEVCLVHTEKHWEWIQSLSNKSEEELYYELQHPGEYKQMDSIYLSPSTPYCAALSAGGAIEACRAVVLGKVKNVFAVIRPPGHHAEREDVKGFCFYDNVSIATKVCQREFGEKCRKVFILDWDVHHGNGIQQATYDNPNVLYISLHVHENGRFYPEGSYRDRRERYGDHLHCGEGAGLGKNVNIPWRAAGMGDADYIYAFQQVVMPIALEFDPDLVIIAAGFDAAEGDMLGCCHVSPAGFAHMTHMLMSLAGGKVAVCLEGGYNLDSIAKSACAVGRVLMGEPPDRLEDLTPTKTAIDDIKMVVRQQSRFWSCLYPKNISLRIPEPHGERMHDVVRRWQASTYWDDFEMSPLFIHRDQLSKSFENQVLATPNYTEARPLIIILHDPPHMLASPDPRTGNVELHNTWLTDSVKTYAAWAVKQGFAVIDVNLPKHVSSADESRSRQHEENDTVEDRTKEATQLLIYLWDNYVELGESSHIILIGTNIGHGAITNFIKTYEERVVARPGNTDPDAKFIDAAISFVRDVPLQSCKSAVNEHLPLWYYDHSLVFVSGDHNFWHSEYARKIRKRFGHVFRSSKASISEMLTEHKDAITDMILNVTEGWREEVSALDAEDELMAAETVKELPPINSFVPLPAEKSHPTSLQPS